MNTISFVDKQAAKLVECYSIDLKFYGKYRDAFIEVNIIEPVLEKLQLFEYRYGQR